MRPPVQTSLLLLLLLSTGCGAVQQSFHGQLDAAFFVGFQNLDFDDLAFAQVVGHFLDALMSDLTDVQQTVLARQQVDQGAEVQDLGHRAFIDLADFNFGGDLFDALLGDVGLGTVGGGDGDRAVFSSTPGAPGV